MAVLLSGLIAAVVATLLSVYHFHLAEKIRKRTDVLLETVSWSDDLYAHIAQLHVCKKRAYTGQQVGVKKEQIQENDEEMRRKLISSTIRAKTLLIYGKGDELKMITAISQEFKMAVTALCEARKETWTESEQQIEKSLTTIDSLRGSILIKAYEGTRFWLVVYEPFRPFVAFLLGCGLRVVEIARRWRGKRRP